MIAHISPADRQRDESRNTLVYADRAKNISNKVGQLICLYLKYQKQKIKTLYTLSHEYVVRICL